MAIAITSSPIHALRGSVGSTAFRLHRGTQVLSAKSAPTNPRPRTYSLSTNPLSLLNVYWNLKSTNEKTTWDQCRKSLLQTNPNLASKFLSAKSLYIHQNYLWYKVFRTFFHNNPYRILKTLDQWPPFCTKAMPASIGFNFQTVNLPADHTLIYIIYNPTTTATNNPRLFTYSIGYFTGPRSTPGYVTAPAAWSSIMSVPVKLFHFQLGFLLPPPTLQLVR